MLRIYQLLCIYFKADGSDFAFSWLQLTPTHDNMRDARYVIFVTPKKQLIIGFIGMTNVMKIS